MSPALMVCAHIGIANAIQAKEHSLFAKRNMTNPPTRLQNWLAFIGLNRRGTSIDCEKGKQWYRFHGIILGPRVSSVKRDGVSFSLPLQARNEGLGASSGLSPVLSTLWKNAGKTTNLQVY